MGDAPSGRITHFITNPSLPNPGIYHDRNSITRKKHWNLALLQFRSNSKGSASAAVVYSVHNTKDGSLFPRHNDWQAIRVKTISSMPGLFSLHNTNLFP
eukprot:scaffold286152_cov19-Tisochrysis_lutea.AAC.1